MAFDKDAMIEQLSGLTVLELVDLVDGLKEKWGVEAAAAMPAGMMMAAGAADGGAETALRQLRGFGERCAAEIIGIFNRKHKGRGITGRPVY